MFKIVFLFTVFLTSLCCSVSSQTDLNDFNVYNKWSLGISFGSHDGMHPTQAVTKIHHFNHYGFETRYMFNNRVGIKLDFGYDLMNFSKVSIKTNYWRSSIQGVLNLGDALRFDTWTNRFGLLFHAGFGMSHMWLKEDSRTTQQVQDDPLFDGVDDMVNYTFGLTPQIKLNNHFSLNANVQFTCHNRQSKTWDWRQDNIPENIRGGMDGYLFNLSVGLTYYIGKKKTHADWTPTIYAVVFDNTELLSHIKELQGQLQDDDGDGVINAKDQEPNSLPGAIVNSKGVSVIDSDLDGVEDSRDLEPNSPKGAIVNSNGVSVIDSDKDGIEDSRDLEPNSLPGSIVNSQGIAIIDSDGDGIQDKFDACPLIPGLFSENGCPKSNKPVVQEPVKQVEVEDDVNDDIKEIMKRALRGVKFETNKSIILQRSFIYLDEVVSVMQDFPQYNLRIEGHTDNVGNDDSNLRLSKYRARACMDYLIAKGIDPSRMRSEGYGETMPIESNQTAAGRAENRRVEFKIIFD
ncbi:MAG: hypothetical protein CL844_06220 [Crocinitomicaceae bacterium]|nr:hypothetical protein [Crocinitomicaceae bacterium]